VSNGSEVLPGIDGRSVVARRYRDLYEALCTDQGGIDRLSEVRLQLIRRFAAASVLAEQMEAKLANGAAVDIAEYCTLASTATRISNRIGMERRAKTVPSLAEYIEARATIDAERAS
jgi:hypothetical protein